MNSLKYTIIHNFKDINKNHSILIAYNSTNYLPDMLVISH